MIRSNNFQFGLRTLLFLLAFTAFALVIIEHLSTHREEALVYSMIVSMVSAIVGVALLALSGTFAFCIAITEKDPNRKRDSLTQCFHLFLMASVAFGPMVLLIALSLFA